MQESIHELMMKLEAEILKKVPLEKWRNAPEPRVRVDSRNALPYNK